MTFFEQLASGYSVLQEAFQRHSVSDVITIVVVIALIFTVPLFIILKGRPREILAGIVLGSISGGIMTVFLLLVSFALAIVFPIGIALLAFGILVPLLKIKVITQITFRDFPTFTWVFSLTTAVVTVCGILWIIFVAPSLGL
ncbi:MAG TPA: hypothetical protein VLG69_03680 [Candidatus Andersenbacteria bacterium]|nr:hypothetical protein [Candidatus Andersenbacteria bacterium]